MISLTVLCEGDTERNFVIKILKPHLRDFDVFAEPINLGGTPTLMILHNQIDNALSNRRSHLYVTTISRV
jgi:hypothetical protein